MHIPDNLSAEQHRQIAALLEQIEAIKNGTKPAKSGKKRKPMTEEAKAKIARKQRARWKKIKAEKAAKKK